MLRFDKLESQKVYRVKDKFTLPILSKDKSMGKGNLITIYGNSMIDTSNFFSNKYIRNKGYRKYYIDRTVKFNLLGKNIVIYNKQQDMYEQEFGRKYPEIKLSMTVGNVSDYNMIYEMGQYMDIINNDDRLNNKPLLNRVKLRFDLIINKLKEISIKFNNHQNKYLYIPVHEFIDNPKNMTIWSKRDYLNNSLISFIRSIETEWFTLKNELSDWTIVFLNVNELFYMNCKDMNAESYQTIKTLFRRYKSRKGAAVEEISDPLLELPESDIEKLDVQVSSDKMITHIEKDIDNELNNYDISSKEKSSIKEKVMDKISTKDDNSKFEDVAKEVVNTFKDELFGNIRPNMSPVRAARINKIQSEMNTLTVDNKTIAEIRKEVNVNSIEPSKIEADIINEDLKDLKFNNFEKSYNEKLMNYDLVNILTKFAEMDRPLYLIKIDKEDTSTVMDKKYTYSVTYEDENGGRHSFKFDYPKFINNKFIHINNSDKLFINQIIPLPVTKTSPGVVQVSSNYKKVFIYRFGKNVSSKSISFFKNIGDVAKNILSIDYGNNIKLNSEYITPIEYDDLGQKYSRIKLKNIDTIVYFNQKEIREICDANKLKYDENNIPFAIENNNGNMKVLLLNNSTGLVDGTDMSPIDFICNYVDSYDKEFTGKMSQSSSAKKLMYTRVKIMNKMVPTILLLSFIIGLEPLLNKLKINYKFSETNVRTTGTEVKIQFNDGYLIYDGSNFSNALILNGLIDIPTSEYNFLQFSGKDVYFEIFNNLYGRRNIGVAFENFNQEFIDPITEEVLEHCKLPTNFVDLMIYANSLLENNTYDFDGDMNNFRIRSNELVNAHLYGILTSAYEKYRATADNKNPVKFSIKQNELFNDIFSSQILEEFSTLNPIFEMDRMRSTSYKGAGGCNMDRAFKPEKRAYNDTMLGVFAQSSPISSNIGISRVLSMNPKIKSLRGYIDAGSLDKVNELNQTNMLSSAELLVPLSATHDDPQRVSMASTQSRHTISTVDSDVPLFGYGYDKVLAKTISDRFAFKSKSSGYVSELNETLGYMILKYDNGESDVVDLTNRQALNTGSGFYINNKLSPNLKLNDRFKANTVVASNKDFFEYNEMTGDAVYKSGPLARVAVIHGSSVFEDSTIVTEEFSERMSSYITEKRTVLLGKNANIYSMKNIGDQIKVNDKLLVFDESYEDDYLNKILEKMSEDDRSDIVEAGKDSVKSKWNGRIIDIKIYYTIPKEELSESLQKLVDDYEKTIKKRLRVLKSNNINIKDLVSLNEETTHIEPVNGKVEGVKMGDNCVMINFYIQTLDKFSGGDKCTYATALKGIVQTLIPKNQEPYLASDPNTKIDAFMSLSGYYSRMTNSFPITLALNSTIIGLENKIKDILNE